MLSRRPYSITHTYMYKIFRHVNPVQFDCCVDVWCLLLTTVVLAGESAFEEYIVLAKDGKGNVQGTWTVVDTTKSTTTNCSATLKSSVSSPLHVPVCALFELSVNGTL